MPAAQTTRSAGRKPPLAVCTPLASTAVTRSSARTETSLSIAGGVILFLISLRMVFSHPEGIFGDTVGAEPFIVPLAIPAIAGPSALATVMLMGSRDPNQLGIWAAALSGAMIVTTLVLLAADRLQRLLGERAVRAFERLMGLVLTAVAVEMLLGGIKSIATQFH